MSRETCSPATTEDAVYESIEHAQAAIPAGHNCAVLLDATHASGVQYLVFQRVTTGWTLAGQVPYRGGDGPAAGVALKWSGN
jgi:hypothetical protein